MALRNALLGWSPPPFRCPATPVAMGRAEREVAKKLQGGGSTPPKPFELEEIYRELSRALDSHGTVRAAGRRALRLAPWVLFSYPTNRPGYLAAMPGVAQEYAAWLAPQSTCRPLLALLHALLLHYPRTLATFTDWLALLNERLASSDSPKLHLWQARRRDFGLLANDGPERVWRRLAADAAPVSELLDAMGLNGDLGTGRFAEQAFLGLLAHVARMMDDGRADAPLERLFAFAAPIGTGSEELLRFPLAREVAEGLLMPFARRRVPLSYKDRVRDFLLKRLGDPRMVSRGWQGVPEEAKAVIKGWLVENSLEDFFRILTATADPIWTYRRDFWRTYLQKGVITEAWVALGSKARSLAKRAFDGEYGELVGALGTQSVLLMRIGGLTIAEWSHSGACRIWLTPTGVTPDFYKLTYGAASLRGTPDEKIIHNGSERYRWQNRVARYIRNSTGITWP
ncbi:hypothetical protein dsx2_2304 [Desulfovibrio sp. X2]|uniref:EH signature domain-containing protein n=1 Tax=Desulfovibrio sp. X2 TaxID=941449 RepID=UPI00035890FB|nr:EH signature domain-containing protein [Desulfovibrio sp. X2]EPR43453.1 hypothetical protein dsx2_2304 [Desulfovibrio sp. X2]